MRIALLTSGSRGDVQPYLALGLGLRRAGFEVRLAAPASFLPLAARLGLDTAAVPGWFDELGAEHPLFNNAAGTRQRLGALLAAPRGLRDLVETQGPSLRAACEGSDAIVFTFSTIEGLHIAEALGVPALFASYLPLAPTGEHPAIFLGLGRPAWSPRLANRTSHALFGAFLDRVGGPVFDAFRRRELGLPPYRGPRFTELPTLLAFSEVVLPRPADWPAQARVTGYWFLPREPGWSPPAQLADFLAAGPPPLYLGLGSLSDRDRPALVELVLEALRRARLRGLLDLGPPELVEAARRPSDEVLAIRDVPHDWLFPRTRAVLCHGGAGTTSAALRAGVPLVTVPHFIDQPFWGTRAFELGAAARPIPRPQLSAERLLEAFAYVARPKVGARARVLGAALRAEDGVGCGVVAIEATLASRASR
ncbi:MAG: glycosyltransferase family 1 protein [Deltaproteobacteria bacterium]|nr:glycosyltransferase family 1 protein [Deltaproteobacteria bacterium]